MSMAALPLGSTIDKGITMKSAGAKERGRTFCLHKVNNSYKCALILCDRIGGHKVNALAFPHISNYTKCPILSGGTRGGGTPLP